MFFLLRSAGHRCYGFVKCYYSLFSCLPLSHKYAMISNLEFQFVFVATLTFLLQLMSSFRNCKLMTYTFFVTYAILADLVNCITFKMRFNWCHTVGNRYTIRFSNKMTIHQWSFTFGCDFDRLNLSWHILKR